MNRTEIINSLIAKNNFKSYLEIGLANPYDNFVQIQCETKHSVDPFFGCDISPIRDFLTYRNTSDEFFMNSSYKYDIIFIDGWHTERQCGKDIINGLKHLNENGIIVVHDCLPATEEAQSVYTNGDVWKCFPELKKQFIEYDVVDCDYGCGIIKYTPDYQYLNYLQKSDYNYSDFKKNRDTLMNVITQDEFITKYIE